MRSLGGERLRYGSREAIVRGGVATREPIKSAIFAVCMEETSQFFSKVGDRALYEYLDALGIRYEYHEHPEAPTIEIAMQYWGSIPGLHCKNLFMRNHKGNHHFLLIAPGEKEINIHGMERLLREGKLSFASPQRMAKYLGLRPGSVSPFGVLHDANHDVRLFLDVALRGAERISFHPNDNRASLVVSCQDLLRFLESLGNRYEFIDLSQP